jgi:hypothetical protein
MAAPILAAATSVAALASALALLPVAGQVSGSATDCDAPVEGQMARPDPILQYCSDREK